MIALHFGYNGDGTTEKLNEDIVVCLNGSDITNRTLCQMNM